MPGRIFMFAGQGAQYFQMARELHDGEPVFRHWMTRLDAVVRETSGRSVLRVLYDPTRGKSEGFEDLSITHPALFMVQYALARTLIDRGIVPDALLGVSLGAFVAVAVAGCLPPEDVVRAVTRQAGLVQEHCAPGGMIAVLEDVGTFHALGLNRYAELAAVNFDSHFVVSAPAAALVHVESLLNERQIVYQRLPVPIAFHSQAVEAAREPLQACFQSVRWAPATLPMVCTARAKWLNTPSHDDLWQVVRRPIAFQRTVQWLETLGSHCYVDVSPSGTLATFVRKILPAGSASRALATLSPFGDEMKTFRAAAGALGQRSTAVHAAGAAS